MQRYCSPTRGKIKFQVFNIPIFSTKFAWNCKNLTEVRTTFLSLELTFCNVTHCASTIQNDSISIFDTFLQQYI